MIVRGGLVLLANDDLRAGKHPERTGLPGCYATNGAAQTVRCCTASRRTGGTFAPHNFQL